MKRAMITCCLVVACASAIFGQGTPSSKATAAINTAVGCTMTGKMISLSGVETLDLDCHDTFTGATIAGDPSTGFVPVMQATAKVSNSQSLFVSPSLVTGLYTRTRTSTKTGSESTAVAQGGVFLRAVLRDPASGDVVAVAEPVRRCTDTMFSCGGVGGDLGVILDSRVQSLTQQLSTCVVSTGGTCDFTLTTDLILSTTSAHTFNFIFPNVGVGVYNVSIEAAVNADATVSGGSGTIAIGGAAFGLGSLTVESVRLVHDFSFN